MGYQSDSVSKENNVPVENTQEILEVRPEHLGPRLLHSPVRNRYSVINGNLVVGKDLRLRASSPKQLEIAGWQVSKSTSATCCRSVRLLWAVPDRKRKHF